MWTFLAALPFGANWFDVVWAIALLFGLWSGIRCGMLGEIVRLTSWVLMVWLSISFYVPVGDWLRSQTQLAEELARLLAFLGIVLGVYLLSLLLRRLLHKWTHKSPSAAFIENVGGAVMGVARMALVMAVLTIWLSLVRSPFWHRHVSRESVFGSAVVKMVPSVAKVAEKQFPETVPFFRDLERPIDPDADDADSARQPRRI